MCTHLSNIIPLLATSIFNIDIMPSLLQSMHSNQYYRSNQPLILTTNNPREQHTKPTLQTYFKHLRNTKQQLHDHINNQSPAHQHHFRVQYNHSHTQPQEIDNKIDYTQDVQEEMLARGNLSSQNQIQETNKNRYNSSLINLYTGMDSNPYRNNQDHQYSNFKEEEKSLISKIGSRVVSGKKGLKKMHTIQYLQKSMIIDSQKQGKPKNPNLMNSNMKYMQVFNPMKEKIRSQSFAKDYQRQNTKKIIPSKLPSLKNRKSSPYNKVKSKTITSQNSQYHQIQSIQSQQQQHQLVKKFIELAKDLKRAFKTNQRIEQTVRALEQFNPLFRKIQRVIGVSLLRIGSIQRRSAQHVLYQLDETYDFFYIILHGEVKLIGRHGMHKICYTGQTILEQILSKPKYKAAQSQSMERAKMISQTWLLQISKECFFNLEEQLLQYGFQKGLEEFKALIHRNHVIKNWLRSKFRNKNKI